MAVTGGESGGEELSSLDPDEDQAATTLSGDRYGFDLLVADREGTFVFDSPTPLYPGHCRRPFSHCLHVGLVSSH